MENQKDPKTPAKTSVKGLDPCPAIERNKCCNRECGSQRCLENLAAAYRELEGDE